MRPFSLNKAGKKATGVIAGLTLLLTHSLPTAIAGDVLDNILDSNKLRVATDSNWPPQSFRDENNEMVGFDVDVARQVAKRLGASVEFVTPSWDLIVAGNWNGRWDVHIGSMRPDSTIGAKLDFPAVYYYLPSVVAVHREAEISNVSRLNGKTVGVGIDTSHEDYLRGKPVNDLPLTPPFTYLIKNATIKTYEYPRDAIDALAQGNGVVLNAVIAGKPTILQAIDKGAPIRIIGETLFYEPVVISIEPGDEALSQRLAAIVEGMHGDGTLSRLSLKWYGIDYSKPE